MPKKSSASSTRYKNTMRPEYDFSNGVRGKYANRFRPDTVMVTLAPDVAVAFPDADAVNDALRVLIKGARKTSKKIAPAA